MAKAELKTKANKASVGEFLNGVEDEQKRADAIKVLEIMKAISGEEPEMWGPSIIGFGHQTLHYSTGRELDWLKIGFSPRKANLTLYILSEQVKKSGLLEKLGPHKTGVGCLYIKRLSDVDTKVLEKLIKETMKGIKKK